MTTKGRLAEQILRAYNGGDVSSDHSISLEEMMLMVTQSVNRLLKREHFDTRVPLSERVPPHASIATYDNITVNPFGDVLSGIACTQVDSDGFYVYWDTDAGFFDTGAGFWAVKTEGVSMTITRTIVATKPVYNVSISNLTYPDTLTSAQVATFITNCPNASAIKFSGTSDGVPNIFLKEVMSNIVVGATTIVFDYSPEDITLATTTMTSYLLATRNLLGSIIDPVTYTTELGNVECCSDTDNTQSLLGSITLPAQPMNLPRGMGVWRVYSKSTPHSPYIPLPSGQYTLTSAVSHNTLGASVTGIPTYEYFSRDTILFNQNVSEMPETLSIQLVVVDPDTIGEYDPLPVPPEMEFQIISEVLQLLGQVPPEDQSVDGNSKTR